MTPTQAPAAFHTDAPRLELSASPHVHSAFEIDFTKVDEIRKAKKAEYDARGVKLTAKGHELLSHAERMLQVRRDMFEAAREPKTLRFTEGLHVGPGRSDVIGVVLPDLFSEYFSELVRGIDRVAYASGLQLRREARRSSASPAPQPRRRTSPPTARRSSASTFPISAPGRCSSPPAATPPRSRWRNRSASR